MRKYIELDDQSKGGADFSLVIFIDPAGRGCKPRCINHGAMNKVSEDGIWRCITTNSAKRAPCRAACLESKS